MVLNEDMTNTTNPNNTTIEGGIVLDKDDTGKWVDLVIESEWVATIAHSDTDDIDDTTTEELQRRAESAVSHLSIEWTAPDVAGLVGGGTVLSELTATK
jgi:hypothetical protein